MNTPVKKTCFAHSVTLACFLAALIPAPALSQDAEPNVPDRTNYDLHCALCHGEHGSAVDTLEKLVKVEIPHLGSSYVQEQSDDPDPKGNPRRQGQNDPGTNHHRRRDTGCDRLPADPRRAVGSRAAGRPALGGIPLPMNGEAPGRTYAPGSSPLPWRSALSRASRASSIRPKL